MKKAVAAQSRWQLLFYLLYIEKRTQKAGEEKGNSSPALRGNPLRDYSADLISTPPQSSAPFSTAKLPVEMLPCTLAVRSSAM